ncbi:hypothetical protein [Phreatobacter sp.]|uniref:hypothetical protein n=1 Tax=Phreatobacter sp. TaxID=1966341 RepID=UPI0025D69471|nr:hypothetical protein [Phreatobacter sp.]
MADGKTMNPGASVADFASAAQTQLKAAGVDTDVMASRAGDLQKMLRDEITSRPFQALAVAAFVGFLYGMRR